MNAVAAIALVLCALTLFYGPFLFGEERKPYGAEWYVGELIEILIVGSLSGRVLGWW